MRKVAIPRQGIVYVSESVGLQKMEDVRELEVSRWKRADCSENRRISSIVCSTIEAPKLVL